MEKLRAYAQSMRAVPFWSAAGGSAFFAFLAPQFDELFLALATAFVFAAILRDALNQQS